MTRIVICLLGVCLSGVPCRAEESVAESAEPRERLSERASTGTLTGRFVYDGEPPARSPLEIPKVRRTLDGTEHRDIDLERFGAMKLTDETLLVGPDRGLQNVAVWVSDKSMPIPPVPPVRRLPNPATLTFKDGRLQPRILAWWADHRLLQLTNADTAPLNLQFDGHANESFNYLLAPQKPVTARLKAEKLPRTIRSSIYSWLQPAYLFPCPHPYVAVTDSEGFFQIPGLPPGQWECRAWHERCGWLKVSEQTQGRFTAGIHAGITDLGTIKVAPALLERKLAPATQARTPEPGIRSVVKSDPNRPGWKALSEARRAVHEREFAAKYVGKWVMRLPAGFSYDIDLVSQENGLLVFKCSENINLLGTFACSKNQLLLVNSASDRVDDYIWQLNEEGNFVLITDRNHAGGRYIGAVLERAR